MPPAFARKLAFQSADTSTFGKGAAVVPKPSTLADLVEEVLEERAKRVTFSDAHIQGKLALLREGFASIDATRVQRERVLRAIDQLPEARKNGWLLGVEAAVGVILGRAARSSKVLVDSARDLLPFASDAWVFTPAAAAATRSAAPEPARADRVGPHGELVATIIADDAGSQPRILAMIRNFPKGDAPPVLLIVPALDENAGVMAEVDPEFVPDQSNPGDHDLCTLRYEAVLPAGEYHAFFGNPRERGP